MLITHLYTKSQEWDFRG